MIIWCLDPLGGCIYTDPLGGCIYTGRGLGSCKGAPFNKESYTLGVGWFRV